MTAIIKAGDRTTIVAPDNARDTRVSRTWRFPLRSTLADDTAQNLIDDACMGHNENTLSHVLSGDSFNSPHDAPSKVRICFAARPGKVLVVLGFILKPDVGILPSHIIYRKPVYSSTIDFGKGVQSADGATDVLGCGLCCVERSAKGADVYRIEWTFKDQPAAKQIDLAMSFLGQGGIVSPAQERALVTATLDIGMTYEQKRGGRFSCAAHPSLMCGKAIKEHLSRYGNKR